MKHLRVVAGRPITEGDDEPEDIFGFWIGLFWAIVGSCLIVAVAVILLSLERA